MKKKIIYIIVFMMSFLILGIDKVNAISLPSSYTICKVTVANSLGTDKVYEIPMFNLDGKTYYIGPKFTNNVVTSSKDAHIINGNACEAILSGLELNATVETGETKAINNRDGWAIYASENKRGFQGITIEYKNNQLEFYEFNGSAISEQSEFKNRVINEILEKYKNGNFNFSFLNLNTIYVAESTGYPFFDQVYVPQSNPPMGLYPSYSKYLTSSNLNSKISSAKKNLDDGPELMYSTILKANPDFGRAMDAFSASLKSTESKMSGITGGRELGEYLTAKMTTAKNSSDKEVKCGIYEELKEHMDSVFTTINSAKRIAENEYLMKYVENVSINNMNDFVDKVYVILMSNMKIPSEDYDYIETSNSIEMVIREAIADNSLSNDMNIKAIYNYADNLVNIADDIEMKWRELKEDSKECGIEFGEEYENLGSDLENIRGFSDTLKEIDANIKNKEWLTESFDKIGFDATSCEDLIGSELKEIIMEILNIVRIIVPVLLIVLGMADFGKAVFAGNEDAMKKAQMTFVKRLIIAVVIFFVPIIVNIILDAANGVWGWMLNDDCGLF